MNNPLSKLDNLPILRDAEWTNQDLVNFTLQERTKYGLLHSFKRGMLLLDQALKKPNYRKIE